MSDMDRLTIYRVPDGAKIVNIVYSSSHLPPGDYIAMREARGEVRLVPMNYRDGPTYYWIRPADIEPYAVVFVREDRE